MTQEHGQYPIRLELKPPDDERLARLMIASRLRAAREIAGLSQDEASRRLGHAHASLLSRIEGGRQEPTLRTIVRLAALYSRQVDHFTWPLWMVYKQVYREQVLEREQAEALQLSTSNTASQDRTQASLCTNN